MKVGLRIGAVSAGALIILLTVGLSSYYSVSKLEETDQWVSHTQDVLEQLSLLVFSATEVQTSARGYLITGQKQYLQINNEAISRTKNIANMIRGLVKNSQIQQKRMDEIECKIQELISFYSNCMVTYDQKGYEPAADMIRTSGGQRLMNAAKALVYQSINYEKGLLDDRMKESALSATHTHMTIIAGTILAIAFVSLFGYLITQGITGPIKSLVRASDNMAHGRFDAIEVFHSKDEFEELAAAFNQLGLFLQESIQVAEKEKMLRLDQEKKLDLLQHQIVRLNEKIEDLITESKIKENESNNYPLVFSGIKNFSNELSLSAARIEELSKSTSSQIQTIETTRISLALIQAETKNKVESLLSKLKHSTENITNLENRIIELTDITTSIDSFATEINSLFNSSILNEKFQLKDNFVFQNFSEQLNLTCQKTKQEAIKSRQNLLKIDKSISKASLNCEESLLTCQNLWKDSTILEEKVTNLAEAFAKAEQMLLEVLSSAKSHTAFHIEIPEKFEHMNNTLKDQGIFFKNSQMKAEELKNIASIVHNLLSAMNKNISDSNKSPELNQTDSSLSKLIEKT